MSATVLKFFKTISLKSACETLCSELLFLGDKALKLGASPRLDKKQCLSDLNRNELTNSLRVKDPERSELIYQHFWGLIGM